MPSPFPGMDPYLEAPAIWPGFHHSLADEIKAQLNAVLSPRYYADVEVRTGLEEVDIATVKTVYPDTAVLETGSSVPAGGTAVAIPAAPIQRLAILRVGKRVGKTQPFSPRRYHYPSPPVAAAYS